MDGLNTEAAPRGVPTEEVEAPSARQTLEEIVKQCEHALGGRIAKRFSTRDNLKALEKRCRALLDRPDEDHAWEAELWKVIATANAVFDQLIAEVEPVGHA